MAAKNTFRAIQFEKAIVDKFTRMKICLTFKTGRPVQNSELLDRLMESYMALNPQLKEAMETPSDEDEFMF